MKKVYIEGMEGFRFLEHTADAKIEAKAETLEEAFGHAAVAVGELVTDTARVAPRENRTMTLTAENREALLYDWIEQILVLMDTEGFLLNTVERLHIIQEEGGWKLEAVVAGDIGPGEYEFRTHVKAMTYAEMTIDQVGDGWRLIFVVDL